MRNVTTHGLAVAALVLLGGMFSGTAFGQESIVYVDPADGDGTAADCTFDAPCLTITQGMEVSGADTVAVRIRGTSSSVFVQEHLTVREGITLLLYKTSSNSKYHMVEGDLTIQGNLTFIGGELTFYREYERSTLYLRSGTITFGINVPPVGAGGPAQADYGVFNEYMTRTALGGNIVIDQNTTMDVSDGSGGDGTCPNFERLVIPSGVTVEVTGTCTGDNFIDTDTTTDNSIIVWGELDVMGTLELSGDKGLHLNGPRPMGGVDSAYAKMFDYGGPNGFPSANVSGMITSDGISTLYISVEAEMLTEIKTEEDGDDYVYVYPMYSGWQNEYSHAYRINGDGVIALDVVKDTQAGVRISPNFGTGALSTNMAGVLWVSSSNVSGSFRSGGMAQTKFDRTTISGDVFIEGQGAPAPGAVLTGIGTVDATAVYTDPSTGNATTTRSLPDPVVECYGMEDKWFSGNRLPTVDPALVAVDAVSGDSTITPGHILPSRGLTTGVYFNGGAIGGSVELNNASKPMMANKLVVDGDGYEDDGGTYKIEESPQCYGGAYFESEKTLENGQTIKTGTTTVQGGVYGVAIVHAMVNGTLELQGGMLDLTAATEQVVRSTGTVSPDYSNVCSSGAPGISGAAIVFSGSTSQTIANPMPLALDNLVLEVKKNTRNELIFGGSEVSVDGVSIMGGELVTNGMLNLDEGYLLIDRSPGTVGDINRGSGINAYMEYTTDSGSKAYRTPSRVMYTGSLGSFDTGHEVYNGITLSTLDIYLATKATEVELTSRINVTDRLNLQRGTLVVTSDFPFTAPSSVIVGDAMVDAKGGFEATTGSLTFRGTMDPSTEHLLPTYPSVAAATSDAARTPTTVNVNSCAASMSVTLSLREGYTAVRNLNVTEGNAVDLAGNDLVARGGTIDVASGAVLCDSEGDVSCADKGEAFREFFDLADAMDKMRYEDTPEHRVLFAEARKEYEASKANAAKTATAGMIHFAGSVALDAGTDEEALEWMWPPGMILSNGHLIVQAGGTLSTTTAPIAPNNADKVMFSSLTLEENSDELEENSDEKPSNSLTTGLGVDYVMIGGDVSVGNGSSIWVRSRAGGHPQTTLMIGGDMMLDGDGRVIVSGHVLSVAGDYMQGSMTTPGNSLVALGGGSHMAMGDFHVGGMHVATDSMITYEFGAGDCAGSTELNGYTVPIGLTVYGDYAFDAASDWNDKASMPANELGMDGTVRFVTNGMSNVSMGGPMSQFCNVEVASDPGGDTGMLNLMSDVSQNIEGRLMLKNGVIGGDPMYRWMITQPSPENSLEGRITAGSDSAVIQLGSRNSYFSGTLSRAIEEGDATGGVVTSGYIFPVGSPKGDGPDSFRPLIMQFPDDLGNTGMASVSYLHDAIADSMEWINLEVGHVDANGNSTDLLLDNAADMFWKVELDAVPAHDPNVRLVADDLPNVFDITGLRIVQWDCDGTNPRLAGVYDVSADPTDDDSYRGNDFINGVPNLTQEGLELGMCSILGVASNMLQNPISADPILGGTARVQFIHNVAGATVDVYLDDNKVADDFMFQSALAFGVVAAGNHTLDIVAAAAPDNSAPLLSLPVRFDRNKHYHVIAHGNAAAGVVSLVIREDVRTASSVSNMVDFYVVHGASALGEIDIRTLDPVDNTRVTNDLFINNFAFDDVGEYKSLDPGGYNIEVLTSDGATQIEVFRFELDGYADKALVLNMSGVGKSAAEGLTMMGVGMDGSTFFPQVITAAATEELPTEFTLLGNYPNPFNPSTRIEFDLPETAQVSITVFDMLGRNVMTLPAQELEAGHSRTVELNATSLASGNYFYRVVATGASGKHIETGRMVLIK